MTTSITARDQTRWRKLGLLYRSVGEAPWLASHASCPQVQPLEGNLFRLWMAPRDKQNRTYCAWFDFDITQPNRVLRHGERPAVSPGGLGTFDERGAMFSWWLEHQGAEYLYYTGWNVGDTTPFRNAIGLAVRQPGQEEFVKVPGPVLDRSPQDPYFVGNPCVAIDGEGRWHLWYLSGTAWHERENAAPYADYNIRHAISENGIDWRVSPGVCIDYAHETEMAIARPAVRYWGGVFHMWYSYRGLGFPYRLGYATSDDGVNWTRRDAEIDLPASASGWDSEMICYPYVFRHDAAYYLIYCGNGFSEGGIGLAVLEG